MDRYGGERLWMDGVDGGEASSTVPDKLEFFFTHFCGKPKISFGI